MRTLSKKTQYSLRALYALSRAFGGPPVLIADMAERESIPKRFLEQILLQLKSEGLVDSKKGKGGGFVLSRSPARVTVGEVIPNDGRSAGAIALRQRYSISTL